jgi:hypothetical protein
LDKSPTKVKEECFGEIGDRVIDFPIKEMTNLCKCYVPCGSLIRILNMSESNRRKKKDRFVIMIIAFDKQVKTNTKFLLNQRHNATLFFSSII